MTSTERGTVREKVRDKTRDSARQFTRWGLGHVMPRTAMRVAGRRGDLQGQLISVPARRRSVPGARTHPRAGTAVPRQVRVRHDLAARSCARCCRATTSAPASSRRDLSGPIGRAFAWAAAERRARAARAAVAAGHRTARPHPLPQARHPRVQRPRRREAARPAPSRSPPNCSTGWPGSRPGRPRRGVLHPAAGHRDRRDPRRAGERAGARARLRRGCRAEPRSRPDLATVPHRRDRARRVRRVARRPPRLAARQSRRRPAQPARRGVATTASVSTSAS